MGNLTTLCYIEKDGCYLMLHRVKKEQDVNKGKWIGLGGKLEAGESPDECVLREVKEECGLCLISYKIRGIITFLLEESNAESNTENNAKCITEYMFLYTADKFSGDLLKCNEGELAWIPKEKVYELPIWRGDRLFLDLLRTKKEFFSLKLIYKDDILMQAVMDGRPMELFDLLDEQGNPTGMVKERSMVHLEGDLHRTAHVWIVRRKQQRWQVLLQKRSKNKDAFPGCYDISSAGHVPAGQEYKESALRELSEELGILAKPQELLEIGQHRGRIESEFYGKPFRNDELSMIYLYANPVDISDLKLQASEVEFVIWQDLSECLEKVSAKDKQYCIWEDELIMLNKYLLQYKNPEHFDGKS